MVAGISEVSDKIKQMNVDAVKSQDIPKTAVKHIEDPTPKEKPVEDPFGRGQALDLSV